MPYSYNEAGGHLCQCYRPRTAGEVMSPHTSLQVNYEQYVIFQTPYHSDLL